MIGMIIEFPDRHPVQKSYSRISIDELGHLLWRERLRLTPRSYRPLKVSAMELG